MLDNTFLKKLLKKAWIFKGKIFSLEKNQN